MNTMSLICSYIRNHPDTWEADMKKKHIKVRIDDMGLAIFKYDIGCDFADPIVCEARGIIIDLNTLDVAGIGFDKFFNSHETYAADIDWKTARVQEKEDGSICKLFWNKYRGSWQWATNGMLDAEEAICEDMFHGSYLELIRSADNYGDIKLGNLDKNKTYIFEICDPYNHTVKYDFTHLFHIGTRNNVTLEETNENIGIEQPKEYPLHTLDECIRYVETMNESEKDIRHEGFVVVDGNWNRVKVKNSLYLKMFYLTTGSLSKKQILELLKTDDIDVRELLRDYPKYRAQFYWYMYQMAALESDVENYIKYTRMLNCKNEGDRKKVAEAIKKDKYSFFGFRAIGNDVSAKELLGTLPMAKYEAYIEDFPARDFRRRQ